MRLNRFFIDSERLTRRTSIEIQKRKGFSLIEVLVGIALVAIAMLGLAQLFTISLLNNSRSDKITNATFLAQQRIDCMRSLTYDELNAISSPFNEQIDTNVDGTIDFRRITRLLPSGSSWDVRVLLFSSAQLNVTVDDLIQNPVKNKVLADIKTIISR